MTKEERELLIQDICERLLYGVKFESYDKIPIVEYSVCNKVFIHEQGYVIIELLDKGFDGNALASTSINLTTVSRLPKPYLRPMSSMTEDELNECVQQSGIRDVECPDWHSLPKEKHFEARLKHSINMFLADSRTIRWLNEHHFDHRGLIEKGLAVEAKEGMYDQI